MVRGLLKSKSTVKPLSRIEKASKGKYRARCAVQRKLTTDSSDEHGYPRQLGLAEKSKNRSSLLAEFLLLPCTIRTANAPRLQRFCHPLGAHRDTARIGRRRRGIPTHDFRKALPRHSCAGRPPSFPIGRVGAPPPTEASGANAPFWGTGGQRHLDFLWVDAGAPFFFGAGARAW